MAEELGFVGEELDLKVRQGQTFTLLGSLANPNGTPYDLTGCTLRGQVRRRPGDPLVVVELVAVVAEPLTGGYEITLTPDQTSAISAGESMYDAESQYVYDLELVDALGRVLPVFWGTFRVHREVTRAS